MSAVTTTHDAETPAVPTDALSVIHRRRSIPKLVAPAPSPDELQLILAAAGSAPDYNRFRPWRFTVIDTDDLPHFADTALSASLALAERTGFQPTAEQIERLRTTYAESAPMILAVGVSVRPDPFVTPTKQGYAAAAAAQNALLAATALGYGSMWRTGMMVDADEMKAGLGLRPDDAIVGFLFLGTSPNGTLRTPNQGEPGDVQRRSDLHPHGRDR